MKKLVSLLTLCPAVLILSSTTSLAQWGDNIMLTNYGSSVTSYNNAWCIATSGNVVHVVWYDKRNGGTEIYYKRSTNEGISWGADTRLTNFTGTSSNPSIAASGSVVHIVWNDDRDGNLEIFYKRSTDSGITWGADTRLTNEAAVSQIPSVTVSGSTVHVVWYDERAGNSQIYYKRSSDAGVSWETDRRLEINTNYSKIPSVAATGSNVHVVWYEPNIYDNICYIHSTDGGTTWGALTPLTDHIYSAVYPSLAVSNSVVHIVWMDARDGNMEIYYKRSSDGGGTWGPDTRLTNNPVYSQYPSVTASGLVVHVVWVDGLNGKNIYYKRSSDGGLTWDSVTQLTNATSSYNPSVAVSGSAVYVVWTDRNLGSDNIYYKRNLTDISTDVKMQDVSETGYKLSQNYPNPFNLNTKISFTITGSAFVSLKVFNIFGQEVSTLVNGEMSQGSYTIIFDSAGLPGGMYTYRMTAGSVTETKAMILVR
jgi:hypothetical protein